MKQGNGVEIAKWPYNCIRQFKAEDETGKFSFVSGRRGPYGVAEYNFGLDDVGELQHALSQFTGAQFSQAPPSQQQQQQPVIQQPPLPPLPPGHHTPYVHGQRPSSVSSVGRHSIGMGSRTDSIDSVFMMSPGHMRSHAPSILGGPRLPPRDYNHTPSGSSVSGSFISDSLISPGGGHAHARTRNSASTGDLLESNLSSSSPQIPTRSVMISLLCSRIKLFTPILSLISVYFESPKSNTLDDAQYEKKIGSFCFVAYATCVIAKATNLSFTPTLPLSAFFALSHFHLHLSWCFPCTDPVYPSPLLAVVPTHPPTVTISSGSCQETSLLRPRQRPMVVERENRLLVHRGGHL